MDWRIRKGDCIAPVEDLWTEEGTDMSVIAWDDYISSFAGQAIWDGKKQCLPLVDTGTCFTIERFFEAEGLEPPKTFDDVLATAYLKTIQNILSLKVDMQ